MIPNSRTNQTPLERLQAKKMILQQEARVHEEKLNANWKYIQQNGNRLVIRSLVSTIIPGKSSENSSSGTLGLIQTISNLALSGTSAYSKGSTGILPMAWNLIRPFIFTWGIKGIKMLFRRKRS